MQTRYLVRKAVITSVAVISLSVIVDKFAIAQQCPPGAHAVERNETANTIEVICECLPTFRLVSGVCKVKPTRPAGQTLPAEARSWYWLETAGVWIERKPESCRRACSGGIYHETAGVWIARTPKRDAESCQRACMDGIDSQFTVTVNRDDILRDWVHRNWSKAPDHLKWKIQRALRDPKALKALIIRNQIAIFRWHRKATAKSAWQKLMQDFPALQVKAEAWLNDDWNRENIALLVNMGVLSIQAIALAPGPRVVAARWNPSMVRQRQLVLNDVGVATRGPSGKYYDLPYVYHGNKLPPKELGELLGYSGPRPKPPAIRPDGYPYSRAERNCWYCPNAPGITVERTPALDKLMKEFFKGAQ